MGFSVYHYPIAFIKKNRITNYTCSDYKKAHFQKNGLCDLALVKIKSKRSMILRTLK